MFVKCSMAATAIAMFVAAGSNAFAYETSPFQFLRYNSSARSSALAQSTVALADDASGVFINPATISTVTDKRLALTFFKHVLDINSGQASYVHHLKENGTLAVSVSYTSFGSFDASDANFENKGTFSAGNFALGASYSNILDENLYYGVTLKMLHANIDSYNSMGIAFDGGLLYKLSDDRTCIGLSVLHAGSQLSTFDGTKEDIPLDVRLGFNHALKGLPLLFNFSFHHLADNEDNFFDKFKNFALGGEIGFGKAKNFLIRFGFDNQIRRFAAPDNDKKMSGFNGGIGIRTKYFNFDYAIGQVGTSATLHRFGINFDVD